MKGISSDDAIAFPKFNPTVKQIIKPGPEVAAIAEILSKVTLLSLIACFAIKSIFST